MARAVRSCVQSLLKFANSLLGMVGVFMILYSIWMIRDWERRMSDFPFDHSSLHAPWFIYTFLGLGVSMCIITCSGHIAAETANGCCLYLYMFLVFVLVAIEAAVTVDVFLNRNWEKDFPIDGTGNLDKLREFVRSDFEMCEWIGLSVVSMQVFCILLAMVLRAVGPREWYCDSDDEYIPERAPLLRNAALLPSYVINDPTYGSIQK